MFNSKRIEELECKVRELNEAVLEYKNEIPGDFSRQSRHLNTNKRIKAIIDYLGIEFVETQMVAQKIGKVK